MKRDLHDLLADIRARGWWKLLGPRRQLLFTGSSPSDCRALQNLRADIRRAERRGDK